MLQDICWFWTQRMKILLHNGTLCALDWLNLHTHHTASSCIGWYAPGTYAHDNDGMDFYMAIN